MTEFILDMISTLIEILVEAVGTLLKVKKNVKGKGINTASREKKYIRRYIDITRTTEG